MEMETEMQRKLSDRRTRVPATDQLVVRLIRPRSGRKTPNEAAREVARDISEALKKQREDDRKETVGA